MILIRIDAGGEDDEDITEVTNKCNTVMDEVASSVLPSLKCPAYISASEDGGHKSVVVDFLPRASDVALPKAKKPPA